MRALYVTPLKQVNDPIPSGDRTIAQAHEKLLQHAGFDVVRPSRLTTFLRTPDADAMQRILDEAEREISALTQIKNKPDLIFTYHCHYKAPDLIGPRLARAFNVPYVIVEGSHANKRAEGAWRLWHEKSEAALKAADCHLVLNPHDRAGLLTRTEAKRLIDWPLPFDDAQWPIMPRWSHRGVTHCVTVAMMREGDKFESYKLLAEALQLAISAPWHLTLIGDGPARERVLALFAPFGDRVLWRGQLEGMALADAYADADLLIWPAINEALGMVFLEAAWQGCPSLAGDEGGVSRLVRHGVSGVLVPPRNPHAFAKALADLVDHPTALERLSQSARAMAQEASMRQSVERFRDVLARLRWPA